jgi:hypothetical protein
MPFSSRTRVVVMLGIAQTLAWASSFYLPAVLATPDGPRPGPGGFHGLRAAVDGPARLGGGQPLGRPPHRPHGGRRCCWPPQLLFALGLAAAGAGTRAWPAWLLAWLVLGLAMGCGLYDAAFAALVHLYGRGRPQSITGITLLAGFASTVGWPLDGT